MQANPYGIEALWAQGDWVTKGVACVLLIMSVLSWYIIATRAWRIMRLRRAAAACQGFWHAKSFNEGLAQLKGFDRANPFRYLAEEGEAARDHHASSQRDLHSDIPLADWLTICLRGALDEITEKLQSGLAILASVGSTAPFVGLFGTVWGIYHALVSIGIAGQASIDKVAGPVGEALIMTAFGLIVAIPAVLGYNALGRGNKFLIGRLNRFAQQLHAYFVTGSPVSRQGSKRKADAQEKVTTLAQTGLLKTQAMER